MRYDKRAMEEELSSSSDGEGDGSHNSVFDPPVEHFQFQYTPSGYLNSPNGGTGGQVPNTFKISRALKKSKLTVDGSEAKSQTDSFQP